MAKQDTQTLKGFRDILPDEVWKRQWLKTILTFVFENWGFEPIETPTLEPLEIFEGQVGEDEKLFYKFKDYGDRNVALRYDQTVPTVRFLGNNLNELTFPFKRYQIAPVFRAEKPQKGRFREFIQADIDIFGVESNIADAETIAICIDVCKQIGFEDFVIKVNSRSLMKDFPYEAIVAIDKLEKIGEKGVIKDMMAKGISKRDATKYLDKINNLEPNAEIDTIFEYLKSSGYSDKNYQFSPTLARSFSYSEGPIWEIIVSDYSAGSIGGGERYDGMVKKITGKDIPATGVAFGFERTLEAAIEQGLVPDFSKSTPVLVTVFNSDYLQDSLKVASELRDNDINAFSYTDPGAKLSKQLKYADKKNFNWTILFGPEEKKNKKIQLKNMATQSQEMLSLEDAIKKISKSKK